MTKLEKLYSTIENSREVGVKLSKDVLQQVEELEEGIIKSSIYIKSLNFYRKNSIIWNFQDFFLFMHRQKARMPVQSP